MTNGTFEKIEKNDEALYGPRKLLLCGFPAAAHPKFKTVMAYVGISDVPAVWAAVEDGDRPLSELFGLPGDTGAGTDSELPRAVIIAGLTRKELHSLMDTCRQAGMSEALWATLTPYSESLTLKRLLSELAAEREALSERTADN